MSPEQVKRLEALVIRLEKEAEIAQSMIGAAKEICRPRRGRKFTSKYAKEAIEMRADADAIRAVLRVPPPPQEKPNAE